MSAYAPSLLRSAGLLTLGASLTSYNYGRKIIDQPFNPAEQVQSTIPKLLANSPKYLWARTFLGNIEVNLFSNLMFENWKIFSQGASVSLDETYSW